MAVVAAIKPKPYDIMDAWHQRNIEVVFQDLQVFFHV
jgi:hypothetical protein